MVRKSEHMFEKVNLTPLALSLLKFLARNPGKEFYVRELVSLLDCSLGGCHKALGRLKEAGLVNKRKSGRNLYYSVNEDYPGLEHFKIFMNITEIYSLVESLKEDAIRIILYGSCSTGKDTQESDIDLFLLVRNSEAMDLVTKRIRCLSLNREIKQYVTTPQRLIKLKNNDPAFYKEINKGIVLWNIEGYE